MLLFSGSLIKAAPSDAINAIPRGPVKHPRPARKKNPKGEKWSQRSVAAARLESDSAIVTHPLLFSERTRVRSILSALRLRCSLLILLDNYLHPSLSAPSFHSSVPPPLPYCPLSKHGLLQPRRGSTRRDEEERGDGRDVAEPRGVGQIRLVLKIVPPPRPPSLVPLPV